MAESSVLWATGLMSLAAIIAAPLIALWAQRKSEEKKALRERRTEIFRALWVNRRRPFYLARVDALNMIDVEFFGESKVRDAWEDLRADYFQKDHPGLNEDQVKAQREAKFATLLYEISQVLGYDFGKTHIRDNVYIPQLHANLEDIEMETRTRILALLKSESLPVRFIDGPPPKSPEPNIGVTVQDQPGEPG